MAITGTGTQADPFVVTTYSELVSKITNPDSLSECYIKVGNDIDIVEEYPFGDMPVLDFGANVFLDGDGKTITNWYYTGTETYVIKISGKTSKPSWMKNLHLANIVSKSSGASAKFLYVDGESSAVTRLCIENCTFVGIFFTLVMQITSGSLNTIALRSCAFNVLLKSSSKFNRTSSSCLGFESCNIRIVSESNAPSYLLSKGGSGLGYPHNCYFDISIPNGSTSSNTTISDSYYDNCVIKLTTPLGSTASSKAKFGNANTGLNVSIINTSASPGVEPETATQLKEVTDQNWHNIAYLQSIGFSAGERT